MTTDAEPGSVSSRDAGTRSMTDSSTDDVQFYAQARTLVHDLYQPKPLIYWTDFLISVTIAYICASVYMLTPFGSPACVFGFVLGAVTLYRTAMFIHEVTHFRHNEMRGFTIFWNIVAGVPMLIPSFFYESHLGHHSSQHYGTEEDGEYLPLGTGTIRGVIAFLAQILVQPLFIFFRFLIGTPVSFVHPRIRQWMLERASSFVIDFRYRRVIRADAPRRVWAWLEAACCCRAWALVILALFVPTEWIRFPKLYLLACATLGLNHLRTLGAHRYLSSGNVMSHQEQFLDSTNIIGGWITGILCPLGLRYHALHHLFPALPYHNLATAHRRLMDQMPADSIYRETAYPSYWSVIAELLAAVTVCPPSASTAIVGQVFNLSTKKRPTAGRAKTRPTPETRS